MNLKLKRLVRTPSSEQYALFDLDQVGSDRQPMTIGKLDMHYTGEGVYGTILLWDEASRQMKPEQRRGFVHALLGEIAQPMGVPNEYVVEFFAPTLGAYELFHNVSVDDGDDASNGEPDNELNDDDSAGDNLDDDNLDDDNPGDYTRDRDSHNDDTDPND